MTERIFPDGIMFQRPRDNAPEFVKGRVSFKVAEAIAFLQKHKNERGYVNLDLLKSKDATKGLYFQLDNWEPSSAKDTPKTDYPASIDPDNIPF